MDVPILEISISELGLALAMVLLAVGISRWQGLGLGRSLIVGALRTIVQLVLVGYAILYVFGIDRWALVIGALVVMLAVAAHTAVSRQERPTRRLLGLTWVALLAGSGLTLVFVVGAIVRVDPWYNPRYLIPLFGMIVGNAMNGAALAAERLDGEMASRRALIEATLALGASPARAAREAVRSALRAAMIPTINGLMVVGVVSLPGMMSGQIIAGASPLTAVRYQIVVMFMLVSAVSVTATWVTLGYRRHFFTAAEQLAPAPGRGPSSA